MNGVSRREFIRLGAAAFAGAALPSFAEICRGASDLSFERLELKVGAKKPFGALHFSDPHLTLMSAAEQKTDEIRQIFKERVPVFPQNVVNFTATLDYASEKGLFPICSGDVVDYVSEANQAFVRRSFAPFRGRMICSIGNHEYWDPIGNRPCARLREILSAPFGNDLTVSSHVVNGVNVVAVDDGVEQIGEEASRRVKKEFEKGLPVVLVTHQPFYLPGLFHEVWVTKNAKGRSGTASLVGVPEDKLAEYRPDQISYARPRPSTLAFLTWLRQQPRLKAILCGHTHSYWQERFSETAVQYVVGGNFRGAGYEILFT